MVLSFRSQVWCASPTSLKLASAQARLGIVLSSHREHKMPHQWGASAHEVPYMQILQTTGDYRVLGVLF